MVISETYIYQKYFLNSASKSWHFHLPNDERIRSLALSIQKLQTPTLCLITYASYVNCFSDNLPRIENIKFIKWSAVRDVFSTWYSFMCPRTCLSLLFQKQNTKKITKNKKEEREKRMNNIVRQWHSSNILPDWRKNVSYQHFSESESAQSDAVIDNETKYEKQQQQSI